MKKNFLLSLVMMLTLACFTACEKSVSVTSDELVGEWLLTDYQISYSYGSESSVIDYPNPGLVYDFAEDGTLTATEEGGSVAFQSTWEVKGNKLIMRELNEELATQGRLKEWTFTEFANGKMSLTTTESQPGYSETYLYHFTKQ